MTVRNPEQMIRQRPACDQVPDYGAGYDLADSPVGVRGERSWEEPVGVWGGKTYEELYVEYAPAARRLASSMVPPDVADDIVAEAFAKVLAVIRAGGGPSHAFQGYLLTAVRHLACDWQQSRRRLTAVADMDVEADDRTADGHGRVTPGIGSAAETQVAARDEARLVARAFGRLPARWRAVLWELEVEGKAPAAVAPMFGLSANGMSALAMRAREGLRLAYLDEHVGTNIPEPCRTYATEFGAGARGRLGQRRRAAMQEHLGQCSACQDLFTELTELNSRLGTILTPAALAAASAAMRSGRHAAMIRASLTGQWRSWRLHPVTTATGAAAGVAIAGGMLLAVNVTPLPGSPAHAAVLPAAPRLATSSTVTPGSAAHRRGQGGGGGGGSPAGTGSPAGPLNATPAGPADSNVPGGTTAMAALGRPSTGTQVGATVTNRSTASATSAPAPASTVAANAPSSTPVNPGQAITNAARNTLTGLTSTAGSVVSEVTSTAAGAVSGATSAAGDTVSGATSTAGAAVSGVTSTAGSAAADTTATVGTTVSGVTTTAGGAEPGAASTTSAVNAAAATTSAPTTAEATAANSGSSASVSPSTSTAVTTGVAAAATNSGSSAAETVSSAASPATNASSAVTAVTGLAGTVAAKV